jgi:hypothetical protein
MNLFRSRVAGNLIIGEEVAAERGKGVGCLRVGFDLSGSHRNVRTVSQVISDQNEAVWIFEWKRPQQDTFDEREHGGCSANAESQR